MKKLFTVTILLLSSVGFSQTDRNNELTFIFVDECTGELVAPDFSFDLFPDSDSKGALSYSLKRGEWITQNSMTIDLEQKPDTIFIPKILFSSGEELHTQRWNYLFCNEIAQGKLTDYYSSGKKRLEGDFRDGKPSEILLYRPDGTLESQEIFVPGTMNYKRINFFDEDGNLLEYELYKNLKRRTIIKTYNSEDKLIDRTVRHHKII